MEYEDRLRITTPEGVELDLTLAGLGSRAIACILDALVRLVIGAALVVLTLVATDGGVAVLIISTLAFLLLFAYDLLFEVRAAGRTPGKRWTGLRVLRESGAPVTFSASAVRNVVRLLDLLPGFYAVGTVAILATTRNQRVGDVVAGTVVVRDRLGDGRDRPIGRNLTPVPVPVGWDATAVTADDLAVVQRFLARRDSLDPVARSARAAELERALRRKVTAPPGPPEAFLEQLARLRDGD